MSLVLHQTDSVREGRGCALARHRAFHPKTPPCCSGSISRSYQSDPGTLAVQAAPVVLVGKRAHGVLGPAVLLCKARIPGSSAATWVTRDWCCQWVQPLINRTAPTHPSPPLQQNTQAARLIWCYELTPTSPMLALCPTPSKPGLQPHKEPYNPYNPKTLKL